MDSQPLLTPSPQTVLRNQVRNLKNNLWVTRQTDDSRTARKYSRVIRINLLFGK